MTSQPTSRWFSCRPDRKTFGIVDGADTFVIRCRFARLGTSTKTGLMFSVGVLYYSICEGYGIDLGSG